MAVPRPLLALGIPLAGTLLTGLFIFLGFPYDLLADRLAAQVERALGVRIEIQEVGPKLHLAGPGLEARGVRATWSGGRQLRLDEYRLQASDTVFIDDMHENLVAASQLGIRTIAFVDASQCREEMLKLGCLTG